MNISRLLKIICIIAGAVVAIYAQADEKQNTYLLIGGIVLLMIGVYGISRGIPSKYDVDEETDTTNSNTTDND